MSDDEAEDTPGASGGCVSGDAAGSDEADSLEEWLACLSMSDCTVDSDAEPGAVGDPVVVHPVSRTVVIIQDNRTLPVLRFMEQPPPIWLFN